MVAGQTGSLEVVGSELGNVRFGSKADIAAPPTNVRFTTKSGWELAGASASTQQLRQLCDIRRNSPRLAPR